MGSTSKRGGEGSGREERGLTWEGGSVARGLGTPVTAGRRRKRCMERGGRRRAVVRLRCPSLDSSPVPRAHTPKVPHLHPAPFWLEMGEGLACGSWGLQHLHPLL